MRFVKCNIGEHAEMSLEYRPGEWSRQLGRGALIDLDEKVGTIAVDVDGKSVERDVLVSDLIAGREDLFVPADASAQTTAKKVDPAPAPVPAKK